ncbi:hypothetical protein CEXT_149621 [Caerostris extrusa]|uniref:Uncharacterized protein n=1 Tax=Caerostris extrusa TaxID=172846 RepID=A0AAV4XT69_CAEEX|nr:hypothetical protein CEXT_149621 [Caerostris extrusa]
MSHNLNDHGRKDCNCIKLGDSGAPFYTIWNTYPKVATKECLLHLQHFMFLLHDEDDFHDKNYRPIMHIQTATVGGAGAGKYFSLVFQEFNALFNRPPLSQQKVNRNTITNFKLSE